MAPNERAVSSVEDLQRFVDEHSITTFKIGAVDLDGLWRGKRIATPYFLEGVSTKGSNICNILFGWDMADQLIDGLKYTGWQTGYPDITLMPDLSTIRLVPWEPGTASVICDIYSLDGTLLPLAPRTMLKRLVERAQAAGYEPMAGYELEFYLLKGTPDDLASAGYADLQPFTRGNHTYSVYRDTASEYVIGEIRRQLADYGIYIEASNSEHGPGQFEVNMRFCSALDAADDAMLLKHSVKELAAKHGLTASFIAKLSSDWAGSSGHCHQSLRMPDGTNGFANADDPSRLSPLGEAYLAGILELAKDFTVLYLPTINSYKRTEGGSWAGSSATWGYDNRTTAIRSIPSAGGAARVENRIAGADANPYLAIGASLAAGLHGVEKGLIPPAAIVGNAYEQADASVNLPTTLGAASDLLEASGTARALLGDAFVDHFVATRRWEIKQFGSTITEWEIARYLEHI